MVLSVQSKDDKFVWVKEQRDGVSVITKTISDTGVVRQTGKKVFQSLHDALAHVDEIFGRTQ